MKVTIDPYAGFCFGVKKTIEIAEKELQKKEKLYCIGDIVHNQEEIIRLNKSGLEITDFNSLPKDNKINVLFRAHGEPPSSYLKVNKNNIRLIDGTCPIVLALQQKIKNAYVLMKNSNGQVVIFGAKNHPEVLSLSGYTNNTAIIIESINEIDQIDFNKPIRLFSQTTKDIEQYDLIKNTITKKLTNKKLTQDYKYSNSICRHVSNRVPKLKEFCAKNDIIIFVSGKKSSNGKYLFDICKSINTQSYFISSLNELNPEWFNQSAFVGISGATSTPSWLMEKVAKQIISF